MIERRESRFVATSVSDHERDGEGAPFVATIVRAEREPYRVRDGEGASLYPFDRRAGLARLAMRALPPIKIFRGENTMGNLLATNLSLSCLCIFTVNKYNYNAKFEMMKKIFEKLLLGEDMLAQHCSYNIKRFAPNKVS
ncbi:DUF2029 domain-containing protein [Sesbania bispinosa]|nr:DUF2029 domain-containing protein [Sesbania bispinosa]